MLKKKNLLGKALALALSGAFFTALVPSASWAMEKDIEEEKFQVVKSRPQPVALIDSLPSAGFKNIFYYFTPAELAKIARVSKTFYYESGKNWCWNYFEPNVNSKKEYVEFIKSPAVTIFNMTPTTIDYKMEIAYGQQKPHQREDGSKEITWEFQTCSIDTTLENDKETVIRLYPLPKEVKSQWIYGVTNMPGKCVNLKEKSILNPDLWHEQKNSIYPFRMRMDDF